MSDFLGTREIAKLCRVADRTVCKWIDTGMLKGCRLPDSNHRRVWRKDLVAFVKQMGMALPAELGGSPEFALAVDFTKRPIGVSVANLKRFANGEDHDHECFQHDCWAVATSYESVAISVNNSKGVSIL